MGGVLTRRFREGAWKPGTCLANFSESMTPFRVHPKNAGDMGSLFRNFPEPPTTGIVSKETYYGTNRRRTAA